MIFSFIPLHSINSSLVNKRVQVNCCLYEIDIYFRWWFYSRDFFGASLFLRPFSSHHHRYLARAPSTAPLSGCRGTWVRMCRFRDSTRRTTTRPEDTVWADNQSDRPVINCYRINDAAVHRQRRLGHDILSVSVSGCTRCLAAWLPQDWPRSDYHRSATAIIIALIFVVRGRFHAPGRFTPWVKSVGPMVYLGCLPSGW